MFMNVGSRVGRSRLDSDKPRSWTASGGETTKTFPVPQTGKKLTIIIDGRSSRSAFTDPVAVTINGNSGSIYDFQRSYSKQSDSVTSANGNGGTSWGGSTAVWEIASASAPANIAGQIQIEIGNYSGSTFYKEGFFQCKQQYSDPNGTGYFVRGWIQARDQTPITSFTVALVNGGFLAGSNITYWVE